MQRLPFAIEEYERRLVTLRGAMQQRGARVLLLDQNEHFAYILGYAPRGTLYQACVVPLEGEPTAVVRAADEETFCESSWSRRYVSYADDEDPVAVIGGVLHDAGLSHGPIGLELDSNFLSVRRFEQIRAALPRAEIVDFSEVLRRQRLRKSPAEIEYHRRAARIADAAFTHIVERIGEGKSEREAALALYETVLSMGGDNSYSGIITSGTRVHAMHGVLGDRSLRSGDFVHTELMPQVQGYNSRLMRTTVIGRPTADQLSTARRLIEIQDEQLATIRPGAVAGEVDRICREQVLRGGLRTSYRNVTGYTLGFLPMVAIPRTSDFTRAFVPSAEWVIEEGMVFHMYVWAQGMAFSETLHVTREGIERLTLTERRLFATEGSE